MNFKELFEELKRRNVYKVAIAYLVTAWLILQVASILLPTFEAPIWVMKALTLFLIIGFPLILLFAWAFELTPEGLRKTKEVNLNQSITGKTGKRINRVIIVSLLLVIGLLIIDRVRISAGNDTNTDSLLLKDFTSLAVFPFNVQGSDNIQYLSEGMVDLISTKLDGIPGMNSIDPNIIMSIANDNINLSRDPIIASELSKSLGAQRFILGNITSLGDELQMTATKYNNDGKLISKVSVDYAPTNDLSSSIDQLTNELISDELKNKGQEFSSLAAQTSENLDALKYFLQGEQARRAGNFHNALELYEKTIELDSNFFQAWLRIDHVDGWIDVPNYTREKIISKLENPSNNVPQKVRDFVKAKLMFYSADKNTEATFKRLINKYGESADFINILAETLYHRNQIYGRSILEAKQFLERAYEIDQNNFEALIHLVEIAVIEKDTSAVYQYLKDIPYEAGIWPRLQLKKLCLIPDLTDSFVDSLINHPDYRPWILWNFTHEASISNLLKFSDHLYEDDPLSQKWRNGFKMGLNGREKELSQYAYEYGYDLHFMTSLSIGSLEYIPLYDQIPQLLLNAQYEHDTTQFDLYKLEDIYAMIKFNLVLGNEGEVDRLAEEFEKYRSTRWKDRVKYYTYSWKAYQERINGNNEFALNYIDSAFSMTFDPKYQGHGFINFTSFDKTLMQAEIYYENGDLEKSLEYFDAMVRNHAGMEHTFSYCMFRKAGLYEELGNSEKAIYYYDLFLEHMEGHDPRFESMVSEAKNNREKLFNQTL